MEEDYKLAKWLNDELNDEELKEFENSSEFALYHKIKETSSHLKTTGFDETKILANVLASKSSPKVVSLHQNWFVKIAAVLILGLGLTFIITSNFKEKYYGTSQLTQTVKLPDDSEVIVNRNSSIEYKTFFWNNNRKLDLIGEAYFKVAKGKTFEVNTALGKVTVLGTQFNVIAKNKQFEVTCFEGKVKVNFNNEEFLLTKGMKVGFNDKNKIESKTAILAPIWTTNQMQFNNENLASIIKELEKNYSVTIIYNNEANAQLFTGKIPAENLDVALKLIASTYHLQIVKTNNNTYLLK